MWSAEVIMKIKIVCVGRLKEKYLVAGMQEYLKRLQAYCKVEVYEVADESIPDNCSLIKLSRMIMLFC